MDRAVTFLAGLSLIALLIGLFRPRWVLPAKLNPSRLRVGLVYGAAVILFGSLAPPPDPAAQEVAQQKSETAADEAKRLAAEAAPAPQAPTPAEAQPTASPAPQEQAPAPKPASLPVKRDDLVRAAEGWGWSCKAPAPAETIVTVGGIPTTVTTEVTFCANPANLDNLRIYATATATHLVGYTGDQMDARHDLPAVADARLTQIGQLLSVEALERSVRAAVQEQRDYGRENSCQGLMDCPAYDETRTENGIEVRIKAKSRVSWDWSVSINQ